MKYILIALVFALCLLAPVSAQEATSTPLGSDDIEATRTAAIEALPIADQLFTPAPTPTVIEIPEGGADVTDTGDVVVIVQKQDEGKNIVIVGLFALVLVLVVVVVWQADRLRVMIPAPLIPVLEQGADAALTFGENVALGTPTTVDNMLMAEIRKLKVALFEVLKRPVEPEPAPVTQGPMTPVISAQDAAGWTATTPTVQFQPVINGITREEVTRMIDERYALGTPLAGPQAPDADAAAEIAAQRQAAQG